MSEVEPTFWEKLQREKVAVRGVIVAVITLIAALLGVNIDEPAMQGVIAAITSAVNVVLITQARNAVTPVDDPRLPNPEVLEGYEPRI